MTQKKTGRLEVSPIRLALRAKFVEEFPCKHGTSFRRICEPDSASLSLAEPCPMRVSDEKKAGHLKVSCLFLGRVDKKDAYVIF